MLCSGIPRHAETTHRRSNGRMKFMAFSIKTHRECSAERHITLEKVPDGTRNVYSVEYRNLGRKDERGCVAVGLAPREGGRNKRHGGAKPQAALQQKNPPFRAGCIDTIRFSRRLPSGMPYQGLDGLFFEFEIATGTATAVATIPAMTHGLQSQWPIGPYWPRTVPSP